MNTVRQPQKRESDGRFALQLKSKRAVKRDQKRQEEREKRKAELIAQGLDPWCFA